MCMHNRHRHQRQRRVYYWHMIVKMTPLPLWVLSCCPPLISCKMLVLHTTASPQIFSAIHFGSWQRGTRTYCHSAPGIAQGRRNPGERRGGNNNRRNEELQKLAGQYNS